MILTEKASRYRAGFVLLTVVSYGLLVGWPELMAALGIGHGGVWFLDLNTLLASNDAVASGLNPYQPNPFDYTGDQHLYSDWWLQLRHVGFGRPDRLWLGCVLVGSFFIAVFCTVRPRSYG